MKLNYKMSLYKNMMNRIKEKGKGNDRGRDGDGDGDEERCAREPQKKSKGIAKPLRRSDRIRKHVGSNKQQSNCQNDPQRVESMKARQAELSDGEQKPMELEGGGKKQSQQRQQNPPKGTQKYRPTNQNKKSKRIRQKQKKGQEEMRASGQEEQQMISEESSLSEQNYLLICKVCKGIKVSSHELECGHSLCELCTLQYQIFSKNCPICFYPVMHHKVNCNYTLDAEIEEFVCGHCLEEDKNSFRARQRILKDYKEMKKLSDESPSDSIDARDEEFQWKKAMIMRSFNRLVEGNRVKYLTVRYHGTDKKEDFPFNSHRMAKLGFYTDRKFIPRLQSTEEIVGRQIHSMFLQLPTGNEAGIQAGAPLEGRKEESKLNE